MSEQLQVGDRARVVFNKEGRIWGGEGYLYENTSQILGAEGVVTAIHGDEITLTATRTTRLVMAAECLTRVETPRRTFEEIVVALANDPLFLSYNCDIEEGDINRDSAHFEHYKSKRMFTLLRCGHFWTETQFVDLSPAQIAAISAACSEIAANYKAEHGKEEAR